MEQSVHITIEEGGKVVHDEWVNSLVMITTDGKGTVGAAKCLSRANQIKENIMVNILLSGNLIAEGEHMLRQMEKTLRGSHIREGVKAFYDEAKEQREQRWEEKHHAE